MMQEEIKFEDVPKAIQMVLCKLSDMDKKIDDIARMKIVYAKEPDRWFNLKELCEYLPNHPAEQTIYGWTSNKKIPYHKSGKRIQFRKSEIDAWILEDEGKSIEEIDAEVKAYIKSTRKHRY